MNRLKVPVLCFCLILLFSSCKKFDEFIPTVNISVYDPGGGAMLNNIASRNSSDVWVTTSDGKVLKSSNQGASWTSYTVGGIELNLSSLSVPSSQVIFTSGLEGFTNRLYKSMDGGMSWTLMAGSLEFKSCSFPDNNTGYSISDGSLYKTSNGAVYW